jgi:hypothetical protein
MASGHEVDKPDKANHPGRQVGRDYHTTTVQAAGDYEQAHAGTTSHADIARYVAQGRTLTPEEIQDYYG